MQLDKTRIAISERNYLDRLDLALVVIRAGGKRLALLWTACVVPTIALQTWLFGGLAGLYLDLKDTTDGAKFLFQYQLGLLVTSMIFVPLVMAPVTLFLGQAMFVAAVDFRRLMRDLWRALPQLMVRVVAVRALFFLPMGLQLLSMRFVNPFMEFMEVVCCVLFLVYIAIRPFYSEIILLEQNPWKRRGAQQHESTKVRAKELHKENGGSNFSRWLGSAFIAGLWWVAIWGSLHALRDMIFGKSPTDLIQMTVIAQLAIWLVAGYFTVVRYLAYLDDRIRTEGWEIELRMRAEANRLMQQMGGGGIVPHGIGAAERP